MRFVLDTNVLVSAFLTPRSIPRQANGIENFWSLLNRGLKGAYVAVEPFHLDHYVGEQVFRFNNRATRDKPAEWR